MINRPILYRQLACGACLLAVTLTTVGCSWIQRQREPYTTERDKTKKGAGYGAAAGAAAAILKGEREADEILAGAAIGAGIGAGVGLYMDRQEERLARIPGTTVERLGARVILVRFDSKVLFAVDSALIGQDGQQRLGQVASVLNDFPKTAVVIQGHTDSTGSEEHNQGLSERRATAVRNDLAGRGVAASRMTALGYGEGYPLASNETPDGRARNRRVEILLKAKAV
ncbi:MAG: OmpA family protein [Acidobacteriota bacterium]|nr:OmpA family protein [Acidobacteriota bacterium]